MEIINQLKEFVNKARSLANSFSDVGEDDNSYDAGALAREAEEVIEDLSRLKGETPEGASRWLEDAKKRLDMIG